MYFDAQGRLRSMLTSWTSLWPEDLFTQAAAGQSWWRTDDLLHLTMLIDELQKRHEP